MSYFKIILLMMLFAAVNVYSQLTSDVTQKNKDRQSIQSSKIKSKSIVEHLYVKGDENVLADSGYKSFYYGYDEFGRITEYKKFHVFTDLTVKELYQYNKMDKISMNTRYNSKDDRIENINYKYNKKGQLKTQIHDEYYNSVRTGVYFSISANITENELFLRVQHDLEIDPPLESYTIVVNVNDPEELNQYVVIGDESDPSSPRYSWSQLTMESQRGLLAYEGPNKKEHTYISRFLSQVAYKYDKSGNLTAKEVYNTAGDMLERETYRYDNAGRRLGYTKYIGNNSSGSGEAYTYNAAGLISESVGVEPNGKNTGRLTFTYDAGNLTEKLWYNASGELSGKFTYSYTDGRLNEETRYRGESEREYSFKYSYNELGNVSEIVKYDVNNHKEKLIRYVYEYY